MTFQAVLFILFCLFCLQVISAHAVDDGHGGGDGVAGDCPSGTWDLKRQACYDSTKPGPTLQTLISDFFHKWCAAVVSLLFGDSLLGTIVQGIVGTKLFGIVFFVAIICCLCCCLWRCCFCCSSCIFCLFRRRRRSAHGGSMDEGRRPPQRHAVFHAPLQRPESAPDVFPFAMPPEMYAAMAPWQQFVAAAGREGTGHGHAPEESANEPQIILCIPMEKDGMEEARG